MNNQECLRQRRSDLLKLFRDMEREEVIEPTEAWLKERHELQILIKKLDKEING